MESKKGLTYPEIRKALLRGRYLVWGPPQPPNQPHTHAFKQECNHLTKRIQDTPHQDRRVGLAGVFGVTHLSFRAQKGIGHDLVSSPPPP